MTTTVRQISHRMSLRKPQIEALEILAETVELLPMSKNEPLQETLSRIQGQYPHVMNFERDFPNLSFALATGVGKTRLMGAMIAYLTSVKKIRDFVILAPNNTILEKLVREFSNPKDPKYVFRGIGEFASQPPKVVTSENFDEGYGVREQWAAQSELFGENDVHIYIFNIAMINSDKGKRRMKNPRETIVGGMSYFEYLSRIENLVVLMDEAHRYRAPSSSKAIEELKPVLGIEMTATPQVEVGGRSVNFQNIIYAYPLSAALKDGYIKEPWVAGRENFKNGQLDEDALELLKLEDGVRIHEGTKIHLQNYGYKLGKPPVKPFMLIIAANLTHANRLESLIKSDQFFNGQYQSKVRVVHSGVKPEEEERMVRDLLEIESAENPIEIVIHVNMLKEGWDVVNLYTIVPLRAANSKTLIEQSLGRGLRLPFGTRTGYIEIDRLTIVSHDRFDEIVFEAQRPDSLIKKGFCIGSDFPVEGLKNIEIKPAIIKEIESYNEIKRLIAEKTIEQLDKSGSRDPVKIGESIVNLIGEQAQRETIIQTVSEILERYETLSIRIPKIHVEPTVIQPGRYRLFTLDLKHLNLQPMTSAILKQNLESEKQERMAAESSILLTEPPVQHLAKLLLDFDSVAENEENTEIVLDLSEQMATHLRSYLKSEKDVETVISQNGSILAEQLFAQMKAHYEPPVHQFIATSGRDFTFLKSVHHAMPKNALELPFDQTPENKSSISSYLFSGFQKSTYPSIRFDSDSERIFSCLLERDAGVLKWVKTPAKSIRLYYQRDLRYEPDFIVETENGLFMCEIKSSAELEDPIVLQKKEAATYWCEHATDHALRHNAKPWSYLFIPHNEVRLTTTFAHLTTQFRVATSFSRNAPRES